MAKHDKSTDLQWDAYKDEVRGRNIYFSGEVYQVYEDYSAGISTNDDCGNIIYKIPPEIASSLTKGQHIAGFGTVRNMPGFCFMWELR